MLENILAELKGKILDNTHFLLIMNLPWSPKPGQIVNCSFDISTGCLFM